MADWIREWRRAGGAPDVEVAIDPAELEGLDEEAVRALYEERLAQQQSTASREVTLHPVDHLPQLLPALWRALELPFAAQLCHSVCLPRGLPNTKIVLRDVYFCQRHNRTCAYS